MPDLAESLVAPVAQALNSSEIPCALWGHCLLGVHGIPSIVATSSYPTNYCYVEQSFSSNCPVSGHVLIQRHALQAPSKDTRPPPAFHLHIDASEVTVDLCLQSDTLWFLPVLDSSLAHPEANKLPSHFTLATDRDTLPPWRPGRGSGVYLTTKQPIVVPKAHVLLEAFLRIYDRDSGKRVGSFGMAMIGYIEQYVDDDGLLDVDSLREPLRTLYKELHEGSKSVKQFERDLKRALQLPESEEDSE